MDDAAETSYMQALGLSRREAQVNYPHINFSKY